MTYEFELWPVAISSRPGSKLRRLPPSLNARMHHMVRHRWRTAFRRQVLEAIRGLGIAPAPRLRICVANETCSPMDRDNLYSSCKPIFDAFVFHPEKNPYGIVADDDEEHMAQECRNVRVRHRADERVRVTVETFGGGCL